MPTLLRELHFTHIELSNTVDGPTIMDYGRGLSLSFGQNNVHKVFACRDHLDSFEVIQRHASERTPTLLRKVLQQPLLLSNQPHSARVPVPFILKQSCSSNY